MRDKDTEWVTTWKRTREKKENRSHQSWKANPLRVQTDKPSYCGEALRSSYITEIHISSTALITASKPERVCDVTTVLIIQTFLIYLLFYVGIYSFVHQQKISFIQSHRRDYSLKANNKPQQSHFVCHVKKKQVPFVFLVYFSNNRWWQHFCIFFALLQFSFYLYAILHVFAQILSNFIIKFLIKNTWN